MTKTERRKMWEERVSAYQASGLTQPNWCKEHDINVHQLRYWLKKFRSEKLFESSSPQWVPVKIDEIDNELDSFCESILVKVGAASIEVKSGFDPVLLANVVKALSSNAQRG